MKNQRKWILSGVCCFLILCFLPVSSAIAASRIEITAASLNVRAGAGTTYQIVAQVTKGAQYTVIATKNGWYQITLAGGGKGWVLASYTKLLAADLPAYVKAADGAVNIRSGPATSYSLIGTLRPGMALPVIAGKNDWYQVQLSDGQTGWVAGWLTAAAESAPADNASQDGQWAAVDSETLKLRKSANNDGTVISTLSRGATMTLLDRTGDWYYVRTQSGLVGYVPFLYIRYLDADTSSVAEGAGQAPVMTWSGGGAVTSAGSVSFAEVSAGLDITLRSDEALSYQVKRLAENGGLSVATDAVLSGALPSGILSAYGLQIAWLNGQNSGLQITWQKQLYYKMEEGADGKSVVLHIGPSPLLGRLIVLDPGHGSYKTATSTDVGAVGASGLQEAAVVLDIAKRAKACLTAAGAAVICTREGNTYLGLEERAWVANANCADVFISIHINSFTTAAAKGTSTWTYAPQGDAGYDRGARLLLADCLQDELLAGLGLADYGIREERFVVVRDASMPAVLIETAFISNPNEEKLLATAAFRQKAAEAIASGLADYFQQIK